MSLKESILSLYKAGKSAEEICKVLEKETIKIDTGYTDSSELKRYLVSQELILKIKIELHSQKNKGVKERLTSLLRRINDNGPVDTSQESVIGQTLGELLSFKVLTPQQHRAINKLSVTTKPMWPTVTVELCEEVTYSKESSNITINVKGLPAGSFLLTLHKNSYISTQEVKVLKGQESLVVKVPFHSGIELKGYICNLEETQGAFIGGIAT